MKCVKDVLLNIRLLQNITVQTDLRKYKLHQCSFHSISSFICLFTLSFIYSIFIYSQIDHTVQLSLGSLQPKLVLAMNLSLHFFFPPTTWPHQEVQWHYNTHNYTSIIQSHHFTSVILNILSWFWPFPSHAEMSRTEGVSTLKKTHKMCNHLIDNIPIGKKRKENN